MDDRFELILQEASAFGMRNEVIDLGLILLENGEATNATDAVDMAFKMLCEGDQE